MRDVQQPAQTGKGQACVNGSASPLLATSNDPIVRERQMLLAQQAAISARLTELKSLEKSRNIADSIGHRFMRAAKALLPPDVFDRVLEAADAIEGGEEAGRP